MKLLNGKKIADRVLRSLKREIQRKQLKLKLAVVLVNRERVSDSFVRQIKKSCQKIGIEFELFRASSKKEVEKIVRNPDNSNIFIVAKKVLSELIPAQKHVEKKSPVVCAIERILKEYKIPLKGQKICLIGRGRLVGKPVAKWLKNQKIKFFNFNKIKQTDIIISGAGKANLITGDMVKRGAVVIDVGGDIDFETVSKRASYITPVPGGVGPVVVACLLRNLIWMHTYSSK